MKTQIDPAVDQVLIETCRTLMTRHKVASETIADTDRLLEELLQTTQDCPALNGWSRDEVRRRVKNLRKAGRMPRLTDLIP